MSPTFSASDADAQATKVAISTRTRKQRRFFFSWQVLLQAESVAACEREVFICCPPVSVYSALYINLFKYKGVITSMQEPAGA